MCSPANANDKTGAETAGATGAETDTKIAKMKRLAAIVAGPFIPPTGQTIKLQ